MDTEFETYLAQREAEEDQLDKAHPGETVEPVIAPTLAAGNAKLAIVIGHTSRSGGAWGVAPIRSLEYPFNRSFAEKELMTAASRRGVQLGLFFRDGIGIAGAYQKVNAFAPTVALELHFNAHTSTSTGTETLYGTRNSRSKNLAEAIQDAMVSALGLRNRGLLSREPGSGERGAQSVNSSNCPSALLEPFFGSNPGDSEIGASRKSAYADAIVSAFVRMNNLSG